MTQSHVVIKLQVITSVYQESKPPRFVVNYRYYFLDFDFHSPHAPYVKVLVCRSHQQNGEAASWLGRRIGQEFPAASPYSEIRCTLLGFSLQCPRFEFSRKQISHM
jgi:hypothetical protein